MKKFHYHEQLLQWKKRQLMLREKYADTPPGFSSESEAAAAWNAWNEEYNNFIEHNNPKIEGTSLPCISFPLIGRENEISSINSMLKSFHTVFLYGIGGIGKTAIALSYITDHRIDYDHVLYAVADKGIMQAVCDDISIPVSTFRYNRKKYVSLGRYFQEKLKALQKISEREKVLIVIDNMNASDDKELRQFLELSCDKIITTRVNYDTVPENMKLPVGAVKEKYWPELIQTYYEGSDPLKAAQIMRYSKQVEGHTLSMKMASVRAYHNKSSDELDSGYDISYLLDSFHLKKTEMKALLYMSVLPPQGIDEDLFLTVSDVSEHTLTSLKKYLLIDSFGTTIRIHPLIADAVKRIISPTCINCSPLLRGFEKHLYGEVLKTGTWHRTYEQNCALEPYIFAIYKAFPEPAPWLATAFEEIATFLWIQGYFEYALPYAIKIYESALEYYGSNHVIPGREALRVAAVYHNNLDHDNALAWYTKGYELLKTVAPRTFEADNQLCTACEKLAREYSHRRNTHVQKKYSDEFKLIFSDIQILYLNNLTSHQKENLSLKYFYFLIEEAKHALREGRINDAHRINESIIKWKNEQTSAIEYRKVIFKEMQIEFFLYENRLEEAEAAAREIVQYTLIYRGEKYKDYLTGLEILADVLTLKKKPEDAYPIYEDILGRLQQDYVSETKWMGKIEKKMNNIISAGKHSAQ